jgi:glycosyltransferase involved in cell wall biosynthesis
VPVIGCVGPIREQSGFNEVLASLVRLRQSRRFRLAVLGDFHARDGVAARRHFTRSPIFEESIVTGPLPHSAMLSYMRQCAIGLMAPRTDGCPNKLLELMLAGVPTVCSALGGAAEIVETGKTGILVPPRDVEATADALRHLLDNAPERIAIGRAAREFVLSQRTSDIEREEWLSAYAAALIV